MAKDSSSTLYSPPWGDPIPTTGELVEYGPSAVTFGKELADYELWTWRPAPNPTKESRTREADAIRRYMRPEGKGLREGVPKREVQVFLLSYEAGHSARWVAKYLGIKRSSVRTYQRRLKGRAL